MVPDIVWKNVYRTDEVHLVAEDCELVKLTFYNDLSVKLKVSIDGIHNGKSIEQSITPLCEDFEDWKATAIMTCEAGDDVWERPKPESRSGVSGQATATQVRVMQQQQYARMQQGLANQSASFGQGLIQGLGQGIFGGK